MTVPVKFIKNSFNALKELLYYNTWIVTGEEITTRQKTTLLYSGTEAHKNYISHLLFEDQRTESKLGLISISKLHLIIRKNRKDFDLVCIEGFNLHRWILQKSRDFFIPLWLNSQVKLPLNTKNHKDNARRIRKHQLDYRIALNEKEYRFFYNKMYLPTMEQRHSDRAIKMSFEQMISQIHKNNAKLMLITMNDKPIAGTVILLSREIPTLWSTGILNADPAYRRTGVASASYIFGSDYLTSNGYQYVDMGLSRAFLSDGILQYKKKWNGKFNSKGRRGFILKTMALSEATISFLRRHPFIYLQKGKLNALVIHDNRDPNTTTTEELTKKNHIDGVEKINIFNSKLENISV